MLLSVFEEDKKNASTSTSGAIQVAKENLQLQFHLSMAVLQLHFPSMSGGEEIWISHRVVDFLERRLNFHIFFSFFNPVESFSREVIFPPSIFPHHRFDFEPRIGLNERYPHNFTELRHLQIDYSASFLLIRKTHWISIWKLTWWKALLSRPPSQAEQKLSIFLIFSKRRWKICCW